MISTTEAMVLGLLAMKPVGAFGSELVHMSSGKLKRSTAYVMLSRLVNDGLVDAIEEPASDELSMPRTRYRINANGAQARIDLANATGMQVVQRSNPLGVLV